MRDNRVSKTAINRKSCLYNHCCENLTSYTTMYENNMYFTGTYLSNLSDASKVNYIIHMNVFSLSPKISSGLIYLKNKANRRMFLLFLIS